MTSPRPPRDPEPKKKGDRREEEGDNNSAAGPAERRHQVGRGTRKSLSRGRRGGGDIEIEGASTKGKEETVTLTDDRADVGSERRKKENFSSNALLSRASVPSSVARW